MKLLMLSIFLLTFSIVTVHATIEPLSDKQLVDSARTCRGYGYELKIHKDWLGRIFKTECIK